MSYILDALRKSEQARQLATRKDNSILFPVELEKESMSWPIPLLLTIIALCLLVLIWWSWPMKTASTTRNADTPLVQSSRSSTAPQEPRQLPAPVQSPAPQESRHGSMPSPGSNITAETRPRTQRAERSTPPRNGFSSSSDPMKDVPHMEIAGYIHNEQGESLAMINNRLVREGEEISPGLRLEKIKENSAIFSYKGYVFSK